MAARIHRRGLRGTRRPHVPLAEVRFTASGEGDLTGAACKGVDPDLFFTPEPDSGSDDPGPDDGMARVFDMRAARARMICAGCPVRLLCLEGALKRNEPAGIFGGLDADERRRLKNARQTREWRCRERAASKDRNGGAA